MFKSVIVAALVASAAAFAPTPSFGVRTSLSAEWTPADGDKWVETNFEGAIDKLKKEAEDRLDDKIKELEGNVATVGKP